MTLIECFNEAHIDNIAACLRLKPDKMILVGNADEMRIPVERYRKLLHQRGQHTHISMCNVQGKNMTELYAALDQLIRQEDACTIDLTGGDEPIILALGAVLAGLDTTRRQKIHIEKYDMKTRRVRDCTSNDPVSCCKSATLTVDEIIFLHGGCIYPESYQPPMDCTARDLERLWRMVSENPQDWNRELMMLNEFESRSESRMDVFLQLDDLWSIANFEQKAAVVRNLLDRFERLGIITNRSNGETLRYTYNSHILRYCTQKAGNMLEVKTLLEGRAVTDKGEPCFSDCRMGVGIDWDGYIGESLIREPETRNEIDVVLMHGLTPLFISCKNGKVDEEELYKLNTVASRFGGAYARKMLVATDLDMRNRALIQRAWDMDILLVTDAAELSREEWARAFKLALK